MSFGELRTRKQKHLKTQPTAEYFVLGSEPIEAEAAPQLKPSFTYVNRYLAKRRVMRTIRRMRQSHNS